MNAFGQKLKSLMVLLEIKNAALAQYLQYDVSYISKWTGGRVLPGEKNIPRIAEGLVQCACVSDYSAIAEKLGLERWNPAEVEDSIAGLLMDAYEQCAPIREEGKSSCVTFVPGEEMIHTVSRLEEGTELSKRLIIVDIFGIEHESRLLLANIRHGRFFLRERQPQRQIRMLIDLTRIRDEIYDTIFLIHTLTSYSMTDFTLYASPLAGGKLIFVEDNRALLTAMLPDPGQTLAVTQTEDAAAAHAMYQKILPLFTQENLLLEPTTMPDMLQTNQYTRSLLSARLRWLVGHITEQFLPEAVFQSVLDSLELPIEEKNNYIRANTLKKSVFATSELSVLFYSSALANLMLTGEVDFYNRRVYLSREQRLESLCYIRNLTEQENIHIQLIHEGFSTDFRLITNPCLFLSDTLGYLRLENACYENNLLLVNGKEAAALFARFYEAIWNQRKDVVVSQISEIRSEMELYINRLKEM